MAVCACAVLVRKFLMTASRCCGALSAFNGWLMLPHLQMGLVHYVVCKHAGVLDLQSPVSQVTQEAHQPAHSTQL